MPRVVKPLTDTEIKKAKSKEKDYYLYDGDGLCLLIRKTGNKLWRCNFILNKKRNTLSLGAYPDVSLKEARERKDEIKEKAKQGLSIYDDDKKEKENIIYFKYVSEKWLELMKEDWSKANYEKIKGNLERNAYPFIGDKDINEITRKDILVLIERMEQRNAIEYGSRLLSNIQRIFKYAVINEYAHHNIVADIDKSLTLKRRKKTNLAAITEKKDVKQLLLDIKQFNQNFKTDIIIHYALNLAPYVPLRPYNIRFLEWDEINFDENIIEISAEKMKMNVPFVMPLSKQARRILKEVEIFRIDNCKYVFHSSISKARCLSENTLSYALHKLGYKDVHTLHGFRSTFSTNAHENIRVHGFHSDIIESCLAHTEHNLVKKAYNRESKYKYIDEKRKLMQWWADWLDSL